MSSVIGRLAAWYRRAAAGRLVEPGQPLHPPVAYPASGAADSVVIRPDLPRDFRPAAAIMVGAYEGRVDVVEWLRSAALDMTSQDDLKRLRSRLEDVARAHVAPAFLGAVAILDEPLSFEFPDNLPELLAALSVRHVKPEELMEQLAQVWLADDLAAVAKDDFAPMHVWIGAPMRGVAGAETCLERTMLKCLRSTVATSVRFRRSAIAITDASTMPRGRLTYCSTSSAMREMSPSSTSATWKPLPSNDLRKVTSACGPTRDWSRWPISPRTGDGTRSASRQRAST
jgi:hypothetical protein